MYYMNHVFIDKDAIQTVQITSLGLSQTCAWSGATTEKTRTENIFGGRIFGPGPFPDTSSAACRSKVNQYKEK